MKTVKDRLDTFEGVMELEKETLLYSVYGRAVAYAQGVERALQSVITLVYDKKPDEIIEENLVELTYKLKTKV